LQFIADTPPLEKALGLVKFAIEKLDLSHQSAKLVLKNADTSVNGTANTILFGYDSLEIVVRVNLNGQVG
jgi:hypothetical protein